VAIKPDPEFGFFVAKVLGYDLFTLKEIVLAFVSKEILNLHLSRLV